MNLQIVIKDGETGSLFKQLAQFPIRNPSFLSDPKAVVSRKPFSLRCECKTAQGKKVIDEKSLFLCSLSRYRHGQGCRRFPADVLNGKALFQLGPLDQGWWPDGLSLLQMMRH